MVPTLAVTATEDSRISAGLPQLPMLILIVLTPMLMSLIITISKPPNRRSKMATNDKRKARSNDSTEMAAPRLNHVVTSANKGDTSRTSAHSSTRRRDRQEYRQELTFHLRSRRLSTLQLTLWYHVIPTTCFALPRLLPFRLHIL